jgi:hypothetical protein
MNIPDQVNFQASFVMFAASGTGRMNGSLASRERATGSHEAVTQSSDSKDSVHHTLLFKHSPSLHLKRLSVVNDTRSLRRIESGDSVEPVTCDAQPWTCRPCLLSELNPPTSLQSCKSLLCPV